MRTTGANDRRRSGTSERLAALESRLEEAAHGAPTGAVARQRAQGKLTVRERLDLLLDPGSFTETGALTRHRCEAFGMDRRRPYGDGSVTGYGTVDGRPVCVFAQDFTTFGGTVGEVFGEKASRVIDLALKTGCPIIGIHDSGGARIQEGVVALALYAEFARRQIQASGVIPQISLILGPCAGGAAYSPALTDFVVMVERTSNMFVTGPDVLKAATGEAVGIDDLGGARMHSVRSGTAHHLAPGEPEAIEFVKDLLSLLPSNNLADPPVVGGGLGLEAGAGDPELDRIIPDASNEPYDMRSVLERVLDDGACLEIQPLFAPNIVCGLGRVEGHTVGVVANQPLHLAGALDIDASEKAARFIRFCDAFGIPILTFVDVPGYLPGRRQEQDGIVRRGAKLLFAYGDASVPRITVVTRKAYGGGYAIMGSKHLGADVNLAWPTAEIAVMGGEGAVNVLYRRELDAAADPVAVRDHLVAEYRRALLNPYAAAERGYVDAVIRPAETRPAIVRALRATRAWRDSRSPRKHANLPL